MHSDCEKMKDAIADSVTNTLSKEDAQRLGRHLTQCPACRNLAQALKEEDLLLTNMFNQLKTKMETGKQHVLKSIETCQLPEPSRNIRTIIMKSKFTKITAAAIIIGAICFVLNPFTSGTPTFAQVIQPILNAQTAIFDIIVGEESAGGPVIHDMVRGSRIRRTISNMKGMVSIINLENGKILSLESQKKEATLIDLKGLPSIPNYLEGLKNLIARLQNDPEFEVEELGQKEIGGRKLIGFRANHPKAQVTIWADPKTALPVRIEQIEGQVKIICINLHFDVPMDDELFSMEVPADYKLQEVDLDLGGSTELDFIEGLRVLAEVVGDGQFPDDVSVAFYLKNAANIETKVDALDLSHSERTNLGMKMTKHLLFLRFFKGEGKWHYAGKGVQLNDPATPIFWYRPKDSKTYRVIYADLHVEDAQQQPTIPQ